MLRVDFVPSMVKGNSATGCILPRLTLLVTKNMSMNHAISAFDIIGG